jgi:hypothetical protein
MTEISEIKILLKEGFVPAMILRVPTENEIRRLPDIHAKLQVRALPLKHPDGRKLMYYMRDPAAIKFAAGLVAEQNRVIGYDFCIYCSGVGPDTIHGRKLYLNDVVDDLRKSLEWDVSISDYPHTFEVSFKIKGDDRMALEEKIEEVRKVALALSLHNSLGFVVSSTSSGTRYQGQPFSLKWGLQERNVRSLTSAQLSYIKRVLVDPTALAAAKALQELYCQVSDDSRITVGWAAIEDIFACPAKHLLDATELGYLLGAVGKLYEIPGEKRNRLRRFLNNPDVVFSEGRNERIARSISEITRESFKEVYKQVRALAKERGRRVHRLSDQPRLLTKHMAFVENALWAKIEKSIEGPNPFSRTG